MNTASRLLALSACLLAVALVSTAVAPAVARPATAHGSPANYTVVPQDRAPGNQDATYEQFAVAHRSVAYLDYIMATWAEGGFSGCGATNSKAFGIDRGNDASGTTADEDLTQYIEETTVNEDEFVADFYERDDAFGSSTNLNEGDEFVSRTTNCFDNPDEPGWYRIRSTVAGWTEDDTYVEEQTTSHYFWICDCANEREAREKLGPPPSESGSSSGSSGSAAGDSSESAGDSDGSDGGAGTATPGGTDASAGGDGDSGDGTDGGTSTAGGSSDGGDGTGGGAGGSADAGGSGDAADGGAATGTPAPGGGARTAGEGSDGGSGAGGASGASGTSASWDDYVRRTPTAGGGPGFGALVALTGLLAGGLLASRSRR